MPPQRLLHHLRRHRKVAGLSQRDLARLLGSQSGEKISRYEHFKSMPSLKTAMAYEIIFETPLASLFPALYIKVKAAIAFHADLLVARMDHAPTKTTDVKTAFLRSLAKVSTDDIREA